VVSALSGAGAGTAETGVKFGLWGSISAGVGGGLVPLRVEFEALGFMIADRSWLEIAAERR
jgi:hypothetical protein